ncbi:Lsr2 family protein [Amycolatopsis sp. DSM 110486]|uniref:histone-like nucleoid-structuring protein Lsr2 n=1 Tax=Amycolatopsis sp. DSM 110486 TaxID=2865832 RepID=UPI001C6A5A66|nr:Lsr2 family protein [Amycolatopsis sp. DSM 110486]QYN18921.1 Lsr2 family protein [Amycolatopsis sp. DSM 110486]
MAQKLLVKMVDDLDGGIATQTVPFGIDGVQYEIDLSDDNAAELRDELARFISHARRVGGRKVKLAVGESVTERKAPTSEERELNRRKREWAQENGFAVSDRGRLPSEVDRAYEEAQREPATPAKATAAVRKRAPRKKASANA